MSFQVTIDPDLSGDFVDLSALETDRLLPVPENQSEAARFLEERVSQRADATLVGAPMAAASASLHSVPHLRLSAVAVHTPVPSFTRLMAPEARRALVSTLDEMTMLTAHDIPCLKSNFEFPFPEVKALFSNVRCPRRTAVTVGGFFLHANYVSDGISSRQLIASQIPCEHELFWRFIIESGYDIIDLSVEESSYAPMERETPSVFGSVIVRLVDKIDETPEECTFICEVKDFITQKSQLIQWCHYRGWKDCCGVSLPILKYLVSKLEMSFQKNTLVHCHAGVGRTGTLLTAYFLKKRVLQGLIQPENIGTGLVELIVQLREQRGERFVQNEEQFFLLLDYAIDLVNEMSGVAALMS